MNSLINNSKYKTELNLVKTIIKNDHIYDLFLNYYFYIDKQKIKLDSNINVYEALFISQLIRIYLFKKPILHKLNILEIGLAYGTSSIILLNDYVKYTNKGKYYIFDPNQTEQWNNIGYKHIEKFIKLYSNNLPNNIKLYEKSSLEIPNIINRKIDISFIDGSHDEKIVTKDIENSDTVLRINGLIIIDDV